MSCDLGGEDLRVVQGVNLILNVWKNLEKLKVELETVGSNWKNFGVFCQVDQIKLIVGTAGDKIANDFLVKKLNELNAELSWRFPHKRMIMRKTMEALDACRIALSRHFQKWQDVTLEAASKALGTRTILEEREAYPTRLLDYKNKEEYLD